MSRTLIVGWQNADRSAGALAFALRFAQVVDADPMLVNSYPCEPSVGRFEGPVWKGILQSEARETLAEADPYLRGAAIARRVEPGPSAPEALQRVAEECDALAIAVGASRRGPVGRVLIGSTALKLLNGAPCPVIVVPRGYDAREGIESVVVGFDGSEESRLAARAAAQLTTAGGASLEVLTAVEPVPVQYLGYGGSELFQQANDQLEGNLNTLRDQLDVEMRGEVLRGQPADVLAEHSRDAGLLVLGSRGYGPRASVLLGSTAAELLHTATCPVLVVPRTVEPRLAADDESTPVSAEAAA